MSGARQPFLLIVLASIVVATSCTFRGPEGIRKDLSREAGVELRREFGLTVGRTGMALTKMVNNMANPEEEEIPLKGVRKVQVGVYAVEGLRDGAEARAPTQPPRLPGWENVVRVHEDGGDVFMLLREENDRIRGMLVVVAEPDEWVLVRLWGKLDRVVEQAMEMAFEKADRPELYEPAVAEYRKQSQERERVPVSPDRRG